jgi:predicted outer membrane protein
LGSAGLAATLVFVQLLAACTRAPRDVRFDSTDATTAAMSRGATPQADGALSDDAIVDGLLATNAAAIRLGGYAMANAHDERLKALARRVVAEHTTLDAETRRLVAGTTMAPGTSSTSAHIGARGNDVAAQLSGCRGLECDLGYLKAMVALHEETLEFLLRAARRRTTTLDSTIANTRRRELAHFDAAWTLHQALAP